MIYMITAVARTLGTQNVPDESYGFTEVTS